MSVKIDVNSGLKDLPTVNISKVQEFQGDLKDLTEVNYNKLKKSLLEVGLLLPFFIWVDPEDKTMFIMDGHQRRRVWTAEGFAPQKVPFVLVPGINKEEAKKNLLVITSQFGTITQEGYDKFTADLSDDWKQQTLHFDGLWREFKTVFANDDLLSGGTSAGSSNGQTEKLTDKKPSASDDDYAVIEFVLLIKNKDSLVNKMKEVKEHFELEKNEDALMKIVEDFKI